jgi:1,2-diacylglycerol 3-alpha-glucosyltransferase
MRIMHVSNSDSSCGGGVISSVHTQIAGLRAAGHEVTWITLDFGTNDAGTARMALTGPVRVTYRGRRVIVPWRTTAQLQQALRQHNPDIVHVHHPFIVGPAAVRAARLEHIPVIFTYHTRYHDYLHYVPLPAPLVRPFCTWLVRKFCSSVHGIIAPSAEICQMLMQESINVPVWLLPSPIRKVFFQPLQARPLNTPLRLLTVSRFVVEKNIYFLLETVAKLAQEHYFFTLVGYGPEEQQLKNYAYGALQLSHERVKFVHIDDEQQLATMYRESDLFLFASTTETQGLVLAEAMASGVPVVALDGPGQREIVISGSNGFLVKNQHEMRQQIELLRNNPALWAEFRESAWHTAQKYHPEYLIKDLVVVYDAVMRNKKCMKLFFDPHPSIQNS